MWKREKTFNGECEFDHPCRLCGMVRLPEGEDPCLGHLPGVAYACCGHGLERGYILFENDVCVRFDLSEVRHLSPVFYTSMILEDTGEVVEIGDREEPKFTLSFPPKRKEL